MFKLNNIIIHFYYANKKYTCEIYYMDHDNYAIRLYKGYDISSENNLFSTYIDSSGGEVTGNAEVYTMDNIDNIIKKCYEIYNFYVNNNMLITKDIEEYDNEKQKTQRNK